VRAATALIDERIRQLGDWRGKTLAKVREIIHAADPQIVEEWKWMGTPVWSHGDIVCTGETYKDGNVRRTIDIHEIKYVHVADSNRLAPGWRHLPLEDLLRVLADLGCDGYLTAEILPKADPESAAPQAAAFLRGCLRRLVCMSRRWQGVTNTPLTSGGRP